VCLLVCCLCPMCVCICVQDSLWSVALQGASCLAETVTAHALSCLHTTLCACRTCMLPDRCVPELQQRQDQQELQLRQLQQPRQLRRPSKPPLSPCRVSSSTATSVAASSQVWCMCVCVCV
jgi:hypothetical protein